MMKTLALLKSFVLPLLMVGLVFHPTLIFAAPLDNADILDSVLQRYQDAASAWGAVMVSKASWLFWSLTLISMVWTYGLMILQKADLQVFFAETIKFFMVTGFFWWLLINGPAIAQSIIDTMRMIGAQATGQSSVLSPSGIVDIGFEIMFRVLDQSSVWSPLASFLGFLLAGAILICLVTIGVNMLLLLVSAWILCYGGVFFLGFGGSRWTSDMAITFYKTVLAVGAQLMAMILIIGIGRTFIDSYYNDMSAGISLKEMVVMAVVVFILWQLTEKIPPMIAGIVGVGGGIGSVGNVGAGAVAGMAAAAVATGGAMAMAGASHAVGGASALKAAFQAAQQNMSSGSGSGGSGSSSGLATAGRFAADMGASLVKGAGQMVKDKAGSVTAAAKERVGQTVGGKLAAAIRNNSNASQGEQGAQSGFGGDSVGAGKGAESEAEKMGAFVEDALTEEDARDSSASDEIASFVNQEGK